MNQGAKMNCCDRAFFLTEMVKLTWNAEKHKICWKACFVVTCLIFLMEMAKLTWNAEKHKICWKTCLLWHVYFFDGNGETYMKCWEAQNLLKSMFCCDMSNFLMEMAKLTWNAEKHKICWKTCFVVTCLFVLMEMAKLTWNAEKQVMLRSKKYLLKSMFCCDMSIFFWWKKLKLLMFDWGTFKKHPNWN